MKKENLYIGCSGFYNNDWKGFLYPEDAKSKDFLHLYSQTFNCVEINSTFYRKPREKTLTTWVEETPDHFKFFIKMPKFFSHQKKMKDCREEIKDYCNYIHSILKDKLAGFLYQFPASFRNIDAHKDDVINNIHPEFLNVIEFRHNSWWQNEIFELLSKNNIIFSGVSFSKNLPEEVIVNHSDALYYRLHGKPVLYKSEYSEEFLDDLKDKIKNSNKTAFVFFNNTWGNAAINNALYLKKKFD